MAWKELTLQDALTTGSTVWILPTKEESAWSRKLDWYVNFQIGKWKLHTIPHMAPELRSILTEEELDLQEIHSPPGSPLLLATQRMLPNIYTLVVQSGSDPKSWMTTIEKLWRNLSSPSIRVFLPDGMGVAAFMKAAQNLSPDLAAADTTVVAPRPA